MASSRMPILAMVLLNMLDSQVQAVEKVKVDAALKFCDEILLLISGDDVLYASFGEEMRTGKMAEMEFPEQFQVLAALRTTDYAHRYFFGRDFYYDRKLGGEMERLDYPESLQEFFDNDGPDAAAWRDNRIFYFKGCLLATYDKEGTLKQRNAHRLGLPCAPDAAWTSENGKKMILLKGDQIWIWDVRKKVDGPMPFSSLYNITSWELMSSDA